MLSSANESSRISIVTIVLNRRDFLKDAIESVLAQAYPNSEHIVVDGGSTDGTVELLGQYSHLKWISEPDDGQADAMNKGLRLVTGEVFGWLNSDDTYLPDALQTANRYFRLHPHVAMIYGTCNLTNAAGQRIGRTRFHKFDLRRINMGFVNINTPAVFVRTQALREVGDFDTSLKATYDVDMWIRIARRYPVMPIPETVSNLRLHKGSGLVGVRRHLAELPTLRTKYWVRRTLWERLAVFPYLKLRHRTYHVLKFERLARQAV